MVVVAVATVAYGLISHLLVGAGPILVEPSAGVTVAIGALLAIVGLGIRVATRIARPETALA
jgi:hypothetical protein